MRLPGLGQHQRIGGEKLGGGRHRAGADAAIALEQQAVAALVRHVAARPHLAISPVDRRARRAGRRRSAVVVVVEDRQHFGIRRVERVRRHAHRQHPHHLGGGVAARARQRHRHGGADRIGREHDIAGRGGELPEQLLAGGVVGPRQKRHPRFRRDAQLRRRRSRRRDDRDRTHDGDDCRRSRRRFSVRSRSSPPFPACRTENMLRSADPLLARPAKSRIHRAGTQPQRVKMSVSSTPFPRYESYRHHRSASS